MRSTSRSSSPGWVVAAAGLLVALLPFFHLHAAEREEFFVFIAFVALGELFEVTLGVQRHSLGLAPGLGFMLLHHSVPQTAVVYAMGAACSLLARGAARRPARLDEASKRVLLVVSTAAIYVGVAAIAPSAIETQTGVEISKVGLGVMAIALLLGEPLLAATRARLHNRLPFWPSLRGQVQVTVGVNLSVVSVGALLALSYPSLKLWSLPLFIAPLAATQYAFRQLQFIRTSYLQTVEGLSKVPEFAGLSPEGHADQVAGLATEIAAAFGMSENEVTEIRYAALLHDIGRIKIDSVSGENLTRQDLAAAGAGIIEETGHFPRVGQMIRLQYDPYRRRGEDFSPEVPLGAKIIKVASTFDELMTAAGPMGNAWDVLERLHLDTAYEYDPRVIQALMRVLERRGDI
jgi:HD domain-containing protein